MKLHNKYSRAELRKKIEQSTEPRTVISFYKYMRSEEPMKLRDKLYMTLSEIGVLGRIYVAKEGINAQISIPDEHLDKLGSSLELVDERLKGIRLNKAIVNDARAFFLLKIKCREKIVADGMDDIDFDPSQTGTYLSAKEFNELSQKESTIVVDMRNHYEYEVGHFENAITYSSDTFREQVPGTLKMLEDKKDRDIVMYCTGGVRCEKITAYFKQKGFEKMYHLKGGIINYKNEVEQENLPNQFIGKNFVFDERLGEPISDDVISSCHQCGKPCNTHTNCKNEGCHLLFIQCPECATKYNHCCSDNCKETLELPVEVRKEKRRGIQNGQNIFNKSKQALLNKFGKLSH